jgi:hypothetical protein
MVEEGVGTGRKGRIAPWVRCTSNGLTNRGEKYISKRRLNQILLVCFELPVFYLSGIFFLNGLP